MAKLLQKFARTHVFWAADFKNYNNPLDTFYGEIPNISDMHLFTTHKKKIPFIPWR
jgi:hypothetical protein